MNKNPCNKIIEQEKENFPKLLVFMFKKFYLFQKTSSSFILFDINNKTFFDSFFIYIFKRIYKIKHFAKQLLMLKMVRNIN